MRNKHNEEDLLDWAIKWWCYSDTTQNNLFEALDGIENEDPSGEKRARMLESSEGGDIALESNKGNDTAAAYASPVPTKSNGRHSFQVIDPVNVLLPADVLKAGYI